MGSWFSSFAGGEYVDYTRTIAVPKDVVARLQRLMDEAHAVPNPRTQEELDACFICKLADRALQHYNSNHQGAEFQYPHMPIMGMKAACVGFRKDLWYHLNFSARRRDDHDEEQSFFAELRYDQCSDDLTVHICTILEEKPLCCFRSSCAFCPDESKILHPSDAEVGCGKEGHEMELFRERRGINGHTNEYFTKSDMLSIPFLQGGSLPRYSTV